ncbi:major facilitator superfamily-related transporter [Plasmodium brasilianum]|uniref:Transporter, putative n=2 Tax=Plasmodium (Plasmodium) TaxID=418103 RepID=A0A1A8VTE8_PLAMA|nr:major facilitator superfamily-related transporter, putative [Plasmodium malariae]KAI4839383.1 major facilitator superfamily-related transporter [Plasmodium brasilianum]SBS83756.1 transporter, putative [Plasmodium malariae]SBT87801.1 major facilitator superfamily-related transporter, putative [Plasmodium malariae]
MLKEDIAHMKYSGSNINDLKVNKWVALSLYSLVASVATFVHAGFSGWQPIIYKTGAFSELCGPNDDVQTFRVDDKISYTTCGNRDAAVNNLFTLSFFVHFFLSSVSGYVLDTFGEKVCFLCGQIILTIAFLILTILKFSYVWYLFFLLLGVSADLSFIPLLKISKYFPGQESLIFGILGSARSTGFAIGLLLKIGFFYTFNFKEDEFYILCIFYMCTCILYSFLVGIFIVPSKSGNMLSPINSEGGTGSSSTDKKHNLAIINEMDNIESGKKKHHNKKNKNNKNKNNNSNSKNNNKNNNNNNNNSNNDKTSFWENIKTLWSHPQKWEYLITVFICSSSMIRFDYFIKTNRSFFVGNNYDYTTLFSLSTVLSFIPTPFFGYLAGKLGSIYSIIVNNIFILLTYIFILFDSVFFRMLAMFTFFLFISFAFSCFYCYVDEKYSKEHFGKLCGIMFAFSALCLILNFYLTYLTNVVYENLGEKKYFPVAYGMNALGVVTLLGCLYLKVTEK